MADPTNRLPHDDDRQPEPRPDDDPRDVRDDFSHLYDEFGGSE